MRTSRMSLLVLSGLLLHSSAGMADDTSALRSAFAKSVPLDGEPYVIARQVLESQGEPILPLLKQKARSSNWRERSLAKALLIRMQEPQKAARWRWAINNWKDDLRKNARGRLVTTISEEVVKAADRQGESLMPGEVVLEAEALPIVIDVLRETGSASGATSERILTRALFALKHWRDPKATGPILQYYEPSEPVVEVLASFGESALPELHAALKAASAPWPEPRKAGLAAKVLGRIGNETSARLLIQLLPTVEANVIRADFCQAIAKREPPNGTAVLFHELQKLAFDRNPNQRDLDEESYLRIRTALLEMGPVAKPTLEQALKPAVAVETRAMAAGIVYELSHPQELKSLYQEIGERSAIQQGRSDGELNPETLVASGRRWFWTRYYGNTDFPSSTLLEETPAPVLIEIAVVSRKEPLIERLSFLKGNELAIETLEWLLSPVQSSWSVRRASIRPLAEIAGVKAIPSLREFIKKHPLKERDRIVEAAILIGDPKAGELLDVVLKHPETQRRFETDLRSQRATIQSIVQVLKGEPNDLAKLLELEDPIYRFAAARILAKRGDPQVVGLLFTVIVEAAGGDPREAPMQKVHQAQNAIVQMGKPTLEAIDNAVSASNARYTDLLAEVLKLRITRPDLDRKVQNALHRRWPGWGKHRGPSLADFQSAGQQIAELAGDEAVPLLEAIIVWPGYFSPTLAAFALAEFQQDRSLKIVVAHAGQIPWGGAALKEFGAKGIRAAKEVPTPDPNRPRFGMRRGRHREATSALTMADDAKGVEGILAGLKLAADGEIPPAKANAYLKLAASYEDDRLIPMIASVVEKQGEDVAYTALRAARSYDDERLMPISLQFLGDIGSTGDLALQQIVRIQGEDTVLFLLEQLEKTRDKQLRIGMIQALAKIQPRSWLFEETKLSPESLRKQAPKIRDALIEQLNAKDAPTQTKAAESLVRFLNGRMDEPATEGLVGWMSQHDEWPSSVTNYVVAMKEPRIAPKLLTLYRKAPLQYADLAIYFAAIDYQPARNDVVAALQKRLEQNKALSDFPEVKILARYGKAGQDALWEFLNQPQSLAFRVRAYEMLCQNQDGRAFEPTAELFQELIRNGLWHPELRPRNHRDRSDTHLSHVGSLADGLIGLDSRQAYPQLALGCLEAKESIVQGQLAWKLRNLRNHDPKYRKLKIPIDSIEPVPIEDEAEVPLLKACELWHQVVVRHHGQLSAKVGQKLIATGEDGLQIGMELFYDWPVPTRKKIEQALANLTHEDPSARLEAAALLAVRKFPAKAFDEALAEAKGENLARGMAIRRWRQTGGRILDADRTEREEFTNLLLADWPIDQLREFTIKNLDRLASIPNEAYMWNQKPLFPMLLSVRYSPEESERALIKPFTKKASPEARKVSLRVEQRGVEGLTGNSADRWGVLPRLP